MTKKPEQLPGEPMTLGNMRHLGVHHLIATCLSDARRHQGLIDVSKFPDDTECRRSRVRSYVRSAVRAAAISTCARTGKSSRRAESLTGKQWR
jgi:hypothetical protein